MSPVALLLVEGGEVAEERERATDWLDGELLCGGRLGRGREMGSLHGWMGRGGGERRWGAFSQVSLLIESWLASNDSMSGRDPTSNHLRSYFGSDQSNQPRAIIGCPQTTPMRVPTWLAILAALASGLDAKALYHRVYHPTLAPDAKFSLRGTLHDGVLVDTSSLQTDLAVFSEFISQLDTPQSINEALYQLALERDSDPSSADWLLSSVKAVSTSPFLLHLRINPVVSANPTVPFAYRVFRLYLPSFGWQRRAIRRQLFPVASPA